uniref:glutathione transferase n=1 Tax=Oryza punctata TaxID=4537 RepID=A0A0E0MA16_ORYPU
MAGRDELKLLGMWASPYVSRAKLALHLKGVSYEYVEEDLGNKSDLFLTSNPVHKTVPVLIHNGNPICESSIIVQYIDEAFPAAGASLLPADPYDRAVARFWAAYIDDKLTAPWRMVYRVKTEEERDEFMKQTLAAVDVLEGGLKECSKGKGCFFGGDSVGYVDVVLGGLVSWVHASDKLSGAKLFDAAKAPLLAAWLERFGELDAAKAVLQDVDRVVEYAKKLQPDDASTAAEKSENSPGVVQEMAGGGELKLLGHWASAYVTRVKLALHLKGVSYEYAEEDLRNKSDLLLASNPVHKTVPVLIHNGNPIRESRIIVQYIDEVFSSAGDTLLPADPHERAVARFWAAYIEDKLVAPWEKVFRAKTEEERAAWMKQMFVAVDVLEGGLKECSKGKGCFFGGDSVGYVDVVLGGAVSFVHANDVITGGKFFDAAKTPLLAAWLERFGELDAAKAVLQDVDRAVEYTKVLYARNAAIAANN